MQIIRGYNGNKPKLEIAEIIQIVSEYNAISGGKKKYTARFIANKWNISYSTLFRYLKYAEKNL